MTIRRKEGFRLKKTVFKSKIIFQGKFHFENYFRFSIHPFFGTFARRLWSLSYSLQFSRQNVRVFVCVCACECVIEKEVKKMKRMRWNRERKWDWKRVCVWVCVRVREREREREIEIERLRERIWECEREQSNSKMDVYKKESQCVSFKSVGINVNRILKIMSRLLRIRRKKFNGFSEWESYAYLIQSFTYAL